MYFPTGLKIRGACFLDLGDGENVPFIILTSNNESAMELKKLSQCPGRAYADTQMFLIIANVLKVFTIGPPAGNPMFRPEDVKYGSGVVRSDQ